ncbi:hypothetical protein, partial [Mycoplasma phocimorsus]|uniref:hypothetical protein n=1 Tax=Mycoplasma phocimorsus TaxID=3045839 RepID=UPI0024BF5D05
ENGESQEAINAEQLYPILKSDGWAEKEKARTAIDWAATVAQAGLTIAEAAADSGEEKHYKTAWKAVGIANKLFQIVLGGTIDSNILRDIKDEAASIAYTYAGEQWVFIKGAEILANVVLDIQEFIMQKSRDAHKESALNAAWNSKEKLWTQDQYLAQKKQLFAERNFTEAISWIFAMFYKNDENNPGIHKKMFYKENDITLNNEKGKTNKEELDIWCYRAWDEYSKKNNKWKGTWKTIVEEKYKDFIYRESDKAPIEKRAKYEVLKSFAAKDGLFDAVIKTLQLINNWDIKKPEARAQELVKITMEATASIAKIVKNLTKKK